MNGQGQVASAWDERMRLIRLRRKKEQLQFWNELKLIPKWLVGTVVVLYIAAVVIAILVNLSHRYNPYGNICIVFSLSALFTSVSFFNFRIRFGAFVPIKCRFPECIRIIFPVPVILNRFAAPRCVFNFFFGFDRLRGMTQNSPDSV